MDDCFILTFAFYNTPSTAINMDKPPPRQEHSSDLRLRCVVKSTRGLGARRISKELEMPLSTVKSILRNYRERGHVFNAPRSGRPRITDERTDRRIARAVEKNRFASAAGVAAAISEAVGKPVTASTVRNRLKAVGFNGRSARKKPYLSKTHKQKRLAYAKRLLAELPREQDWKDVLFTDEASVQLNGSTGMVKVWRKPHEAFDEKCTVPTHKNVRLSLMVWSSISASGVGIMHFCERTVNGDYYRNVLKKEIPTTRALLGLPTPTPFVQDGAPAHTAALTKECLRELELMDFLHPPQSPDLNPIESLWSIMKAELHKRPASSLSDLKDKLKQIWYSIDSEVVEKCCLSMPKRLAEVVEANGGNTRY